MTDRPYSRVYFEIVGHPRFERVYRNPHALGTWLQMLLTADAMYPMTPPMPPRNPTVRMLIDVGLVEERPANCYSMRGLEGEREHRSAIGRNAAAVRYQRERSANPVPRRDEQSKEETSNGANAPGATALPNGNSMGFRPKEPGVWGGASTHDGRHGETCGVCHPELAKPAPRLVKP